MRYEKVVIEQIPDEVADLTGLGKHNRSKMPGTIDSLPATLGFDGRYVTGFDEKGADLLQIKDEVVREELRKEREELRKYLEAATGEKDLTATSPFWETFRIQLHSDVKRTLYKSNPMDVIAYHVLIANGYAAPTKNSAADPSFVTCKYFCYVEERTDKEDISTFRKRHEATALLVTVSENNDHLSLILKSLLGERIKKGMKPDTLYRIATEYITNVREPENIAKFTRAAKAPIEDIQYKVSVDQAVKRKIIKVREGYYQRGQVTLGKSLPEVYSNLKKPEFATEFLSIQEELESN